MTIEDYQDLLFEQNYACGICRQSFYKVRGQATDHDHQTHHVRGFLCRSCNTCLGWLEEYGVISWWAEEYETEINEYLAQPQTKFVKLSEIPREERRAIREAIRKTTTSLEFELSD